LREGHHEKGYQQRGCFRRYRLHRHDRRVVFPRRAKFAKRNPNPIATLDDGLLTPRECALQAKCLWQDEDNKPHWVSLDTRKSGIHQANLPVYQWNSECYQLRQDRFGHPENVWIACPR
jgi:hypothetical protein